MFRYETISIGILGDGNRTVADVAGLGATGAGSSGREPGDKADAQIGEDLAIARALRSMAAHLEKRANGRMRHQESIKAHKKEIAKRNVLKLHALVNSGSEGRFRECSDF